MVFLVCDGWEVWGKLLVLDDAGRAPHHAFTQAGLQFIFVLILCTRLILRS
jgi:hypothetical protein